MSTFSGIEETECLHFQECDDIPSAYSAYGAEYIPYACGTNSVALRNPFRTHTEYEVDTRGEYMDLGRDPSSKYRHSVSVLHLIFRATSQHILVNVREWHFVQHSLYRGFMEIPRLRSPYLRPNTMRAIRLLPYGSHIKNRLAQESECRYPTNISKVHRVSH